MGRRIPILRISKIGRLGIAGRMVLKTKPQGGFISSPYEWLWQQKSGVLGCSSLSISNIRATYGKET